MFQLNIYQRILFTHKFKPNISRRKITSYNPTNSRVRSNRVRYYTNKYGNRVQSPTIYNSKPAGATALCRDGTYSFSQIEGVPVHIMVG